MFGKDKPMSQGNGTHHTTLISAGTEIVGDIHFTGSLEIEGKVRGNIAASAEGDATVRVLGSGMVEGNIKVPVVVINGTVKGDVHSSTLVELAANARVAGNVHYTLVEMVKGAQINGSLIYANSSKPGLKVAADNS